MAGEVYAKIERQCGWWEVYARTVPIAGIIMFLIVWHLGHDLIDTLIATGTAVICATFAVWWWWAVQSVAHLARSHWIMHEKIQDIHQELTSARQDLQALRQNVKRVL
jgi:hypothetical protein